jgi:hypothetical protein
MTEDVSRWCVLLPCSETETWAVPQNCLGEILTLQADTDSPPDEVQWRDRIVPVIDLGSDDGSVWREPRRGSGLVAVFLGLKGEGCEYWALALRGPSLSVVNLVPEEVEDAPEQASDHASAAFIYRGVLCQVPDLDSFQKKIALSEHVA